MTYFAICSVPARLATRVFDAFEEARDYVAQAVQDIADDALITALSTDAPIPEDQTALEWGRTVDFIKRRTGPFEIDVDGVLYRVDKQGGHAPGTLPNYSCVAPHGLPTDRKPTMQEKFDALPERTRDAVVRVSDAWRTGGIISAQRLFDQLTHELKPKHWETIAMADYVRWHLNKPVEG